MVEENDEFLEMGHLNQRKANDGSDPVLSNKRLGILALLDDFVYQILSIRKVLFTVFISSIVLAPLSIALSIYIFTHPSFNKILDAQDNFGEVLEVLLVSIFAVSAIWLVMGIKQYKSIGSWNHRFNEYLKVQKEMEKKIMLKYGLMNEGEE